MIRSVFQNSSPLFTIILSGLIMVVSFILVFIFGLLVIMPFIDISIAEIPNIYNDLTNTFNVNLLKYIQGLNTIGLFIIPPFIISYFVGEKAINFLNLKFSSNYMTIVFVIIAMISALPLINYLAEINSNLKLPEFLSGLENKMRNAEENAQRVTEIFIKVNSVSGYFANLVVIALLPSLGEELIFRGMFQKLFIKWTKSQHLGILLAAILFSAFHFQFFSFLPRMLMGLFFGYLLVWCKSIWIPIIAHFINNATAVTFYYLYNINVINTDIENIGAEKDMFAAVILSIVLITILIYVIYKYEFINKDKNLVNCR